MQLESYDRLIQERGRKHGRNIAHRGAYNRRFKNIIRLHYHWTDKYGSAMITT